MKPKVYRKGMAVALTILLTAGLTVTNTVKAAGPDPDENLFSDTYTEIGEESEDTYDYVVGRTNCDQIQRAVKAYGDWSVSQTNQSQFWNYSGKAESCHAYVNYAWKAIYGYDTYYFASRPKTAAQKNWDNFESWVKANARPGDILRADGGSAPHSVLLYKINDSNLEFYEYTNPTDYVYSSAKYRVVKTTMSYAEFRRRRSSNPDYFLYQIYDGYYEDVNNLGGTADTVGPRFSGVWTQSITENGYNVTCNVWDNESGIAKVEFPTWTENNGQDDLIWHQGVNDGDGWWHFDIKISDHNYEGGRYFTHIYAHDNAGNWSMYEAPSAYIEKKIKVTGVSLNIVKTTLEPGDTIALVPAVTPDNASDKTVTWSTSDFSVASVDANGLVKALGAGTCTITVKTNDQNKKAYCEITVKEKENTSSGDNGCSDGNTDGCGDLVGAEITLSNMDIFTTDGFTYRVSDFDKSMTVLIFGRSACGNTTAMLRKAAEIRDRGNSIKLVFLAVDETDSGLNRAASDVSALASLNDPYNNNMMWRLLREDSVITDSVRSIYLPACFVVNNCGKLLYSNVGYDVEGLEKVLNENWNGNDTDNTNEENGENAQTVQLESIILNETNKSLCKGGKFTIVPEPYPSNAVVERYRFDSDDDDVLWVDVNGTVRTIGTGDATIRVSAEGTDIFAECRVHVYDNPDYTMIAKQTLVLNAGENVAKWKSSDSSIAKVKKKGKKKCTVTAKSAGTVTITGYDRYGSEICTRSIKVEKPSVRSIWIEGSVDPYTGEKYNIYDYISGVDTYRTAPTFKSSKKSVLRVASDGSITPVKNGSGKITVRYGKASYTIRFRVALP